MQLSDERIAQAEQRNADRDDTGRSAALLKVKEARTEYAANYGSDTAETVRQHGIKAEQVAEKALADATRILADTRMWPEGRTAIAKETLAEALAEVEDLRSKMEVGDMVARAQAINELTTVDDAREARAASEELHTILRIASDPADALIRLAKSGSNAGKLAAGEQGRRILDAIGQGDKAESIQSHLLITAAKAGDTRARMLLDKNSASVPLTGLEFVRSELAQKLKELG